MSDFNPLVGVPLMAERCGRAAATALEEGACGMMIAVFRRSFYVEMAPGRLACLGPEQLGAGPLNVLCRLPDGLEWEAVGLIPGCPARIAGGALHLGDRCRIDLSSADCWRPQPLPRGATPAALRRNLATMVREAGRRYSDTGLFGLANSLEGETGAPPSAFARAAGPGLAAFADWIASAWNAATVPPEPVAGLIGLGPGLTPSGDDYLGGALIALRALGEKRLADRLAGWTGTHLHRTGTISAAHLRAAAAAGEGAEALHAALAALCGLGNIASRLGDIDAIGHSSGWDALAGAVAVIRAIAAR